MIKKFLTFLVFVSLLLLSVSFTVSNHQSDLTLSLFPLPGPGWTLPVYIWIFAILLIGIFVGFLMSWWGSLSKGSLIAEAQKRAKVAELELEKIRASEPKDQNTELNRALAKLPN